MKKLGNIIGSANDIIVIAKKVNEIIEYLNFQEANRKLDEIIEKDIEPKEKSLSEIIKILEDLKYEMAGNEYVSETNSHQESFNLGIEMCLVKLEKVIWKLKNL